MRRAAALRIGVLIAVTAALAVCSSTAIAGNRPATSSQVASVCDTGKVHFAKTKFVFHMGLAFGAFHRYIYKPLASGAFSSSAPGRIKAGVKAALAAAFVWHELKLACKDANNSGVLRPLLTPLNLIVTQFTALEQKLKGGNFGISDLTSAGDAVNALQQKSTSLGFPIHQLFGGFTGG